MLGPALASVLVVVVPASHAAAWNPSGSGSGRSVGLQLAVPASATATATSDTTIHLAWTAPSSPSAVPDRYKVLRAAPTGATVCTVTAPTTTCDDTALTPGTTYTYTVTSLLSTSWTSGASAAFTATTDPTPPTFVVALSVASNKTAGVAFSVQLTAQRLGITDTSYTGPHTIIFSGPGISPNGTTPSYPPSVTFTNGVGTATMTLFKAEAATLTATEGTRVGSTSVTVTNASAARLLWSSASISCASGSVIVGNAGSYTSKVTIADTYANPVTVSSSTAVPLTQDHAGTGTLNPASLTVPPGTSQTSASFTYTLPNGNPPNVTVTASSSGVNSVNCIIKKS